MGKIILDAALRARIPDLTVPMEINDENDRFVGLFLPLGHYTMLQRHSKVPAVGRLTTAKIPLSPEEIARRLQEKGGCSLDEIWKRIGAK